MRDAEILRREWHHAESQVSRALDALIFFTEHIQSRPGGPLRESDRIALEQLAHAAGNCITEESASWNEYANEQARLRAIEADRASEDAAGVEFRRRQSAAHSAVQAATQSGELVRPATCETCGDPHDRIIAHHDSYDEDKRLDVRWLCPSCHGKHHAEHGSAA